MNASNGDSHECHSYSSVRKRSRSRSQHAGSTELAPRLDRARLDSLSSLRTSDRARESARETRTYSDCSEVGRDRGHALHPSTSGASTKSSKEASHHSFPACSRENKENASNNDTGDTNYNKYSSKEKAAHDTIQNRLKLMGSRTRALYLQLKTTASQQSAGGESKKDNDAASVLSLGEFERELWLLLLEIRPFLYLAACEDSIAAAHLPAELMRRYRTGEPHRDLNHARLAVRLYMTTLRLSGSLPAVTLHGLVTLLSVLPVFADPAKEAQRHTDSFLDCLQFCVRSVYAHAPRALGMLIRVLLGTEQEARDSAVAALLLSCTETSLPFGCVFAALSSALTESKRQCADRSSHSDCSSITDDCCGSSHTQAYSAMRAVCDLCLSGYVSPMVVNGVLSTITLDSVGLVLSASRAEADMPANAKSEPSALHHALPKAAEDNRRDGNDRGSRRNGTHTGEGTVSRRREDENSEVGDADTRRAAHANAVKGAGAGLGEDGSHRGSAPCAPASASPSRVRHTMDRIVAMALSNEPPSSSHGTVDRHARSDMCCDPPAREAGKPATCHPAHTHYRLFDCTMAAAGAHQMTCTLFGLLHVIQDIYTVYYGPRDGRTHDDDGCSGGDGTGARRDLPTHAQHEGTSFPSSLDECTPLSTRRDSGHVLSEAQVTILVKLACVALLTRLYDRRHSCNTRTHLTRSNRSAVAPTTSWGAWAKPNEDALCRARAVSCEAEQRVHALCGALLCRLKHDGRLTAYRHGSWIFSMLLMRWLPREGCWDDGHATIHAGQSAPPSSLDWESELLMWRLGVASRDCGEPVHRGRTPALPHAASASAVVSASDDARCLSVPVSPAPEGVWTRVALARDVVLRVDVLESAVRVVLSWTIRLFGRPVSENRVGESAKPGEGGGGGDGGWPSAPSRRDADVWARQLLDGLLCLLEQSMTTVQTPAGDTLRAAAAQCVAPEHLTRTWMAVAQRVPLQSALGGLLTATLPSCCLVPRHGAACPTTPWSIWGSDASSSPPLPPRRRRRCCCCCRRADEEGRGRESVARAHHHHHRCPCASMACLRHSAVHRLLHLFPSSWVRACVGQWVSGSVPPGLRAVAQTHALLCSLYTRDGREGRPDDHRDGPRECIRRKGGGGVYARGAPHPPSAWPLHCPSCPDAPALSRSTRGAHDTQWDAFYHQLVALVKQEPTETEDAWNDAKAAKDHTAEAAAAAPVCRAIHPTRPIRAAGDTDGRTTATRPCVVEAMLLLVHHAPPRAAAAWAPTLLQLACTFYAGCTGDGAAAAAAAAPRWARWAGRDREDVLWSMLVEEVYTRGGLHGRAKSAGRRDDDRAADSLSCVPALRSLLTRTRLRRGVGDPLRHDTPPDGTAEDCPAGHDEGGTDRVEDTNPPVPPAPLPAPDALIASVTWTLVAGLLRGLHTRLRRAWSLGAFPPASPPPPHPIVDRMDADRPPGGGAGEGLDGGQTGATARRANASAPLHEGWTALLMESAMLCDGVCAVLRSLGTGTRGDSGACGSALADLLDAFTAVQMVLAQLDVSPPGGTCPETGEDEEEEEEEATDERGGRSGATGDAVSVAARGRHVVRWLHTAQVRALRVASAAVSLPRRHGAAGNDEEETDGAGAVTDALLRVVCGLIACVPDCTAGDAVLRGRVAVHAAHRMRCGYGALAWHRVVQRRVSMREMVYVWEPMRPAQPDGVAVAVETTTTTAGGCGNRPTAVSDRRVAAVYALEMTAAALTADWRGCLSGEHPSLLDTVPPRVRRCAVWFRACQGDTAAARFRRRLRGSMLPRLLVYCYAAWDEGGGSDSPRAAAGATRAHRRGDVAVGCPAASAEALSLCPAAPVPPPSLLRLREACLRTAHAAIATARVSVEELCRLAADEAQPVDGGAGLVVASTFFHALCDVHHLDPRVVVTRLLNVLLAPCLLPRCTGRASSARHDPATPHREEEEEEEEKEEGGGGVDGAGSSAAHHAAARSTVDDTRVAHLETLLGAAEVREKGGAAAVAWVLYRGAATGLVPHTRPPPLPIPATGAREPDHDATTRGSGVYGELEHVMRYVERPMRGCPAYVSATLAAVVLQLIALESDVQLAAARRREEEEEEEVEEGVVHAHGEPEEEGTRTRSCHAGNDSRDAAHDASDGTFRVDGQSSGRDGDGAACAVCEGEGALGFDRFGLAVRWAVSLSESAPTEASVRRAIDTPVSAPIASQAMVRAVFDILDRLSSFLHVHELQELHRRRHHKAGSQDCLLVLPSAIRAARWSEPDCSLDRAHGCGGGDGGVVGCGVVTGEAQDDTEACDEEEEDTDTDTDTDTENETGTDEEEEEEEEKGDCCARENWSAWDGEAMAVRYGFCVTAVQRWLLGLASFLRLLGPHANVVAAKLPAMLEACSILPGAHRAVCVVWHRLIHCCTEDYLNEHGPALVADVVSLELNQSVHRTAPTFALLMSALAHLYRCTPHAAFWHSYFTVLAQTSVLIRALRDWVHAHYGNPASTLHDASSTTDRTNAMPAISLHRTHSNDHPTPPAAAAVANACNAVHTRSTGEGATGTAATTTTTTTTTTTITTTNTLPCCAQWTWPYVNDNRSDRAAETAPAGVVIAGFMSVMQSSSAKCRAVFIRVLYEHLRDCEFDTRLQLSRVASTAPEVILLLLRCIHELSDRDADYALRCVGFIGAMAPRLLRGVETDALSMRRSAHPSHTASVLPEKDSHTSNRAADQPTTGRNEGDSNASHVTAHGASTMTVDGGCHDCLDLITVLDWRRLARLLLDEHCPRALANTADPAIHDRAAYAAQELLRIFTNEERRLVDGVALHEQEMLNQDELVRYRWWSELRVKSRQMLSGFTTTTYTTVVRQKFSPHSPEYRPGMSYGVWLFAFFCNLASRCTDLFRDVVRALRNVAKRNASLSLFLLPYMVVHILAHGSEADRAEVLLEFTTVLRTAVAVKSNHPHSDTSRDRSPTERGHRGEQDRTIGHHADASKPCHDAHHHHHHHHHHTDAHTTSNEDSQANLSHRADHGARVPSHPLDADHPTGPTHHRGVATTTTTTTANDTASAVVAELGRARGDTDRADDDAIAMDEHVQCLLHLLEDVDRLRWEMLCVARGVRSAGWVAVHAGSDAEEVVTSHTPLCTQLAVCCAGFVDAVPWELRVMAALSVGNSMSALRTLEMLPRLPEVSRLRHGSAACASPEGHAPPSSTPSPARRRRAGVHSGLPECTRPTTHRPGTRHGNTGEDGWTIPLQRIFAALNDHDSARSIHRLSHGLSLASTAFSLENSGDWQQALQTCELVLEHCPQSTAHQCTALHCMHKLGQLHLMSRYAEALLGHHRISTSHRRDREGKDRRGSSEFCGGARVGCAPTAHSATDEAAQHTAATLAAQAHMDTIQTYANEAAWRLGEWGKVAPPRARPRTWRNDVCGHTDERAAVSLAVPVVSWVRAQCGLAAPRSVYRAVAEQRRRLLPILRSACREGYVQGYPHVVMLHALADIELATTLLVRERQQQTRRVRTTCMRGATTSWSATRRAKELATCATAAATAAAAASNSHIHQNGVAYSGVVFVGGSCTVDATHAVTPSAESAGKVRRRTLGQTLRETLLQRLAFTDNTLETREPLLALHRSIFRNLGMPMAAAQVRLEHATLLRDAGLLAAALNTARQAVYDKDGAQAHPLDSSQHTRPRREPTNETNPASHSLDNVPPSESRNDKEGTHAHTNTHSAPRRDRPDNEQEEEVPEEAEAEEEEEEEVCLPTSLSWASLHAEAHCLVAELLHDMYTPTHAMEYAQEQQTRDPHLSLAAQAKLQVLVTNWTVEMGARSPKEVVRLYEQALAWHPSEKAHHHLGLFYDRMYNIHFDNAEAARRAAVEQQQQQQQQQQYASHVAATRTSKENALPGATVTNTNADGSGTTTRRGTVDRSHSTLEAHQQRYQNEMILWTRTYALDCIKNFGYAMQLGTSTLSVSLPRMLTLWLNSTATLVGLRRTSSDRANNSNAASVGGGGGSSSSSSGGITAEAHIDRVIKRLNALVENLLLGAAGTRIPPHIIVTALPQLLSRLGHISGDVVTLITRVVVDLMSHFAQQCLWHVLPIAFSKQAERVQIARQRILTPFAKTSAASLSCLDNAYAIFLSLIELCTSPADPLARSGARLTRQPYIQRIAAMLPHAHFILPVMANLTPHVNAVTPQDVLSQRYTAVFPSTPTFGHFDDAVQVMSSLQKPKRIWVHSNEGEVVSFLCKSKDEPRKDIRMMEVAALMNTLFVADPDARRRRFALRRYAIAALTDDCAIIEWVNNISTLRSVVNQTYLLDGTGVRLTVIKNWYTQVEQKKLSKRQLFTDYILPAFPPVLHQWFHMSFTDTQRWYAARELFAQSTALWSMAGHLVGLGDRHGENLMLDLAQGEMLHVDFACMFDKGETLEVPERVRFRLTQNVIDGMGVLGAHGPFRTHCEVALRCQQRSRNAVMSVVETMLHDPLVEWSSELRTAGRGAAAAGRRKSVDPRSLIDRMGRRLDGFLDLYAVPREQDTLALNVESQVSKLISHASALENLSEMYIWWSAWI